MDPLADRVADERGVGWQALDVGIPRLRLVKREGNSSEIGGRDHGCRSDRMPR